VGVIFITILLTIGYSVRFFIGVCLSSIGSHPFFSSGGWDGYVVCSMFGLFGLSIFGGSIFSNFVDGLIGGPVTLSYQDKILLREALLLGTLFFLSFRVLSSLRNRSSYVVSSPFFRMWFLVFLSSQPLVYAYFVVVSAIKAVFDTGWFERFGGVGSYNLVLSASDSSTRYYSSVLGLTVFGAASCFLFLVLIL